MQRILVRSIESAAKDSGKTAYQRIYIIAAEGAYEQAAT